MPKQLRWLLLIGILIIATFLRFYHLTTIPGGLYPDEAMNGNNATEVAETGHFLPFYVEDNGREGLYINILAITLKIAPVTDRTEPWIVRVPAAIAGVATVWGLYLLVGELLGDAAGLFAAFLLSVSFWGIIFSRIGFRAILAPLFLVWALWLLIKAFRAKHGGDGDAHATNGGVGWWYAVLAGAVYAAGFYTYIAYRDTPVLFLLFIPFFRKTPGFWKKTALFIAATFIVSLPIGWYFVSHPGSFFGRTTEIAVTAGTNPIHDFAVNIGKELFMFNWHGDYNWRQNVSGAPELFWPVGILFLLGIAVSGISLWKSWRSLRTKNPAHAASPEPGGMFPPFALLLTFAWFAFGILPAAASDEGIPHALRSILALAPALIFAAIGGIWAFRLMTERLGWKPAIVKAIAAAFLVFTAMGGYTEYFVTWARNPNVPGAFNADYVAIGNAMNALPAATPKYVIVNAGGVPARGIPVPAETVMFVTHSFTPADAAAKNIHYVVPSGPNATGTVPQGTPSEDIFYVN